MNELIVFCFVTFLMTGNQGTYLERNPPPRYEDIGICMKAANKLGMKLRADGIRDTIHLQAYCGCMGVEEAQQLNLIERDQEAGDILNK